MDTATLGFVMILLGVILVAASSFSSGGKFAVVGFIGPVPVGFGNDARLAQIAIIIGIAIFILLLFFGRGFL